MVMLHRSNTAVVTAPLMALYRWVWTKQHWKML